MKESLTAALDKARSSFTALTLGQKMIAVLGSLALVLGGFMVFRWASAPTYVPLYSNLSASDASAVVDQLDSQGTQYEIAGGGSTIMVPRESVYQTRIALSGEGIPSGSDGGYSILDDQGMSLSQDAEDTNFKRAMEGELAKTIEAMDGVQTAIVHLAIPKKEVFSDEQDPTTASVLVKTSPGDTLTTEQVQAVVNLVASSIDGLDPDQVTVADSTGKVLSAPGGSTAADGSARTQMTSEVEASYRDKLQAMLDRVVGPGNSTVQVTADLDFDDATIDTQDYTLDDRAVPMSSSESSESYTGADPNGSGTATGVVGPDGQMETGTTTSGSGTGDYTTKTTTVDNAPDLRTEHRETAPGAVSALHVGVVLNSNGPQGSIATGSIANMVTATAGIKPEEGDTISVDSMPFDTTADSEAKKELAAAAAADASAARWQLYRRIGTGVLIAIALLVVWMFLRRRRKRREEERSYLVEQIREDNAYAYANANATQVIDAPAAALALEQADARHQEDLREEIDTLIERQPDDVATLLRGWLAERP